MKIEELKKLLSVGENKNVEFKSFYRIDMAGKEVCAFLNSKGGYLVCGVEGDEGNVVGLNLEENIKKIEMVLIKQIIPKAPFFFELHKIEGKEVLVIEVPAGKDIPYSFRNEIYIRAWNKANKASVNTIREMILRRQNEPERWERRFSDAQIDLDVDYDHLQSIGNKIKNYGRYSFAVEKNKNTILESLSLEKFGRLTNAGDVLLCSNTANRYPQVIVKAASFPTGKTSDEFRDFKNFEGPLLEVLEDVFNFIIRNTSTRSHFLENSLERKDENIYPLDAIREGLINAFVHRDYSDHRGSLSVFIYPDRLQISNSGEFPKGITAKRFGLGHISVLRNPDIANIVYLCGMMEKIGRGGLLIQKSCKKRGLPEPVWTSRKDLGVTLTLFAPLDTTEAATEVTTEVTTEVRKILEVMSGEKTRKELQEKLELKNDEHFRKKYIVPALEVGLIEYTIPYKPNSRLQKYRLTTLGKKVCADLKEENNE